MLEYVSNVPELRREEHKIQLTKLDQEYFLSQFALADGKNRGQFHTPRSIESLNSKILEPFIQLARLKS